MKEISWTELKALRLLDIKAGQCLRVTGDGQVAFYIVVEPQGNMIAKVEGICSQIDTGKGLA